jgi:hypothetical protein
MGSTEITEDDRSGQASSGGESQQIEPKQITPEAIGGCIVDAAMGLTGKARESVINLLSADIPAHQFARDSLVKVGLLPERTGS